MVPPALEVPVHGVAIAECRADVRVRDVISRGREASDGLNARGEARHGVVTCTLLGAAGARVSATPDPDSWRTWAIGSAFGPT